MLSPISTTEIQSEIFSSIHDQAIILYSYFHPFMMEHFFHQIRDLKNMYLFEGQRDIEKEKEIFNLFPSPQMPATVCPAPG